MEPQRTALPDRPIGLIVKVGIFNAALVTVISALTIALFSGAGTEQEPISAGIAAMHQVRSIPSWLPDPLEVGEAAVLLCPITALSCGSFGLLAGLAGAIVMSFRRRHIRSTKRYLVETAIVGFALAVLFPLFDVLMNRAQGMVGGSGLALIAPFFGSPCALLSALVFRKRFMARN